MKIKVKGQFAQKGEQILGDEKPGTISDFLEQTEDAVNLRDRLTGGVYDVPVELINPNPYQPRKYFDQKALEELAQSIKHNGVIQPIVIRQGDDNGLYLVAGERRLKAAQMSGLECIPAILTEGNPIEISLIENLQRENLKPVEEAEALEKMIKVFDYTQEQVARVIGKARSTVAEILTLNRLPEPIKEECRRADISRRVLIEVAKQDTPEEMATLFEKVKAGNLKSESVRRITREDGDAKRRTPAGVAIEKARNLYFALSKLDTSTISDEERDQLVQELRFLRDALEKVII